LSHAREKLEASCQALVQSREVPVTRAVLRELEAAHRAQMTMHLEKDLKSAKVLREMRQ
jgi:hypothetical protein